MERLKGPRTDWREQLLFLLLVPIVILGTLWLDKFWLGSSSLIAAAVTMMVAHRLGVHNRTALGAAGAVTFFLGLLLVFWLKGAWFLQPAWAAAMAYIVAVLPDSLTERREPREEAERGE